MKSPPRAGAKTAAPRVATAAASTWGRGDPAFILRARSPARARSRAGWKSNPDAGGGESPAHLLHFPRNPSDECLVTGGSDDRVDPRGQSLHLRNLHAARGHGGRADAKTRGIERLARVVGDGVVVA